jgi:hypothetical protein
VEGGLENCYAYFLHHTYTFAHSFTTLSLHFIQSFVSYQAKDNANFKIVLLCKSIKSNSQSVNPDAVPKHNPNCQHQGFPPKIFAFIHLPTPASPYRGLFSKKELIGFSFQELGLCNFFHSINHRRKARVIPVASTTFHRDTSYLSDPVPFRFAILITLAGAIKSSNR